MGDDKSNYKDQVCFKDVWARAIFYVLLFETRKKEYESVLWWISKITMEILLQWAWRAYQDLVQGRV